MVPNLKVQEDGAILIVNKPVGPTSFDVVRSIKRIYPKQKVGHAGTLDPFADGVLVILIGKATKLSDRFLNQDKRYLARLKLGEETDSFDLTGKRVRALAVPPMTSQEIEGVLKAYEGEWHQTPPMFSAKKVNGVRLYEYARKNVDISRPKTAVYLREMVLKKWESPYLEFEVACSKGTYIRSLGHEIAQKLGSVGHLTALKRLKSGSFSLDKGWLIEDIAEDPIGALGDGKKRFMEFFGQKNEHIQGLPRRADSGNSCAHNLVIE